MRWCLLVALVLVVGSRLLLAAGAGSGSGYTPLSHLASFHAALAGADAAPVDILAIGDSITLGQAATSTGARWPDRLAAALAAAYSTTVATHYPPVWDSGSRPFANPWSTTGSPTLNTNFGPGRIAGNLTTGKTMSYTFTGTAFDLYYAQGPSGSGFGQFTYEVDSGGTTNVDARNATQTGSRRIRVTGLSAASHTVDLVPVSGSVPIEGIIGYNGNESSGIHLWNAGHGGYTSDEFTDATKPHWLDLLDTVDPGLVIITLGVNDAYGPAVAVADFKANLQQIISDVRAGASGDPPFLVLGLYQAVDRSTWVDYITAMQEVVNEDAHLPRTLTFLSLVDDFGGYSDVVAGTNVDSDRIHPTSAGHEYIAGLVEAGITP
jgi:lysophospholipase L1-like esterase